LTDGISLANKETKQYDFLKKIIEEQKKYLILGISLQRVLNGYSKDRS